MKMSFPGDNPRDMFWRHVRDCERQVIINGEGSINKLHADNFKRLARFEMMVLTI